jgi:predicted permease
MNIPVLQGRVFTDSDTADSQQVAVIDQYLVNRYFSQRGALGQQLRRGGPNSPPLTIIGVVGTINSIDLGQPVTKERVYRPVMQQPVRSMALVLKTAVDPITLVPQVRAAVQSIDPEQPIADVRTMEQWVFRSLEGRRSPMLLLALFGLVALILSAIGIYGVLAFGVAQRVREFGIRQALGADRRSILVLVFRQGIATTAIGVVLGLGAAMWLTRYLQSQLFSVRPLDLPVFAGVTILLFVIAVLACYIPARRATRIDPMQALRES